MLKDIKDLYENDYINKGVIIEGWIKNHRKQKEYGFIDVYDGTYFKPVQIVYDNTNEDFDNIQKFKLGSAVRIFGTLIKSPSKGQNFEVKLNKIELEGDSDEDYPIQPKNHSREYLREIAYLRPRVNLFQAVFKIRSIAAMAIHSYFQERNYVYVHTPIITSNDGEGAGEVFQVTTLDLDKIAKTGKVDYEKDFFGKKVGLCVTGQLEGETFAHAFKKIYTFGPTFRAEVSNTKIHASEFWMIEPEVAFCDLNGLMNLEEDFLKYVIKYVMEKAHIEMEFLDKFVENNLLDKLNKILESSFARVTHEEAINILLNANKKFETKPIQGEDIATEHEKFLTEEHFKSPVFITDWPKDIKAFYMRLNDDNKTVAAVDLLVPGAGELMGGSQREERLDLLVKTMENKQIPFEGMDWYLNLRRYGGTKHSGFGMGFERLLIYLTGVENIRDVIPYPRTPGNCEF